MQKQYPHFNPKRHNLQVKVASVKSSSHSKYNVNYHFIWIPKYRKRLLRGKVVKVLTDIIEGQCVQYGWDCLALEVMPDHVHLFLSANPSWSPSKIVNILKGNTSRQLRLVFKHLQFLKYPNPWKSFKHLWAKGYYVGTAGHVSQEQVMRYILEQEQKGKPFNYSILEHQKPSKSQTKLGDFNA